MSIERCDNEICGTCGLTYEEHDGRELHRFQGTNRYEFESVSADARSWLVQAGDGVISWGKKRQLPVAIQELVGRGLLFRSILGFSITDKGQAVLERVS